MLNKRFFFHIMNAILILLRPDSIGSGFDPAAQIHNAFPILQRTPTGQADPPAESVADPLHSLISLLEAQLIHHIH